MKNYAATQVYELLKRGPAEGDDFYRLHMSGNGPSTKSLNVTEQQALAIAAVLNFENFKGKDPATVGNVFVTILTSDDVMLRNILQFEEIR